MTPRPDPGRLADLLAARELGLLNPVERAELDALLARHAHDALPDVSAACADLRDLLKPGSVPPRILRSLHDNARLQRTPMAHRRRWTRWALAVAAMLTLVSGALVLALLRASSRVNEAERREQDLMAAISLDPRANQLLLDGATDTRSATLADSGNTIATVRWSSSLQRGVLGVALTQSTDPTRERLTLTLIASDGSRVPVASVEHVPIYGDAKLAEATYILAPAQTLHDVDSAELAIEFLDGSPRRVLATAPLR